MNDISSLSPVSEASSETEVTGVSGHFEKIQTLTGTVENEAGNLFSALKPSHQSVFETFYNKYTGRLSEIMNALDLEPVQQLVDAMLSAREEKRRIFVMGNGGSASTAAHMVNDFSKHRFEDPALNFRMVGLSDNLAWITATANDEGYDRIFINQLQNLMDRGDLVIAISSSGNSANVSHAVKWANENGAMTFGIVGFTGGTLSSCSQKVINIPTKSGQYGFHEDLCLILNHIISIFIYEQDRKRLEERPQS